MIVVQPMIQIYTNLIKAGKRTIDTIPEQYRQPVQEKLDQENEGGQDA